MRKTINSKLFNNVFSVLLAILCFSNMLVPVTFAFDFEDTFINYDFSNMAELPQLTYGEVTSTGGRSTMSLATDEGVNVLRWQRNYTQNNSYSMFELPLSKEIKAEDFPIVVEYSTKFANYTDRRWGNFALKGTDENGNVVKSLYGATTWSSYADIALRCLEDNSGKFYIYTHNDAKILYNDKPLDYNKYYVHHFEIEADGSYTYKIKEDVPGAAWENIRSNYLLRTLSQAYPAKQENAGKLPKVITSLYTELGFFNGSHNNFTDEQKAEMSRDKVDLYRYVRVYSKFEYLQKVKDGIFVSPNGKTGASGTINDPLSSIEDAVELFVGIKELCDVTPTVYLMGGDYYLEDTVNITNKADGLKICAYQNDIVNIYGMKKISQDDITIADSDDCNGRLPQNLIGKILRIDLSDFSQNDLKKNENYNLDATDYVNYRDNQENENLPELPYNCELFDNNKMQTIARWPDEEWAHMGETVQHNGTSATFKTANSLNWDENADDILIRNFRPYEYHCLQGDVVGFDKANQTVTFYQVFHNFPILTSSRYYLFNIPEEITAKGEYYINYDEKAAYYYPENLNNLDDIAINILTDGIIRIEDNSKNISIEGINFIGSKGSAITSYYSENIDVENCNFSYQGDCGIFLSGCTKCDLTQNTYDNIGVVSVYIRGGNVPSLTSGENTVTQSRFTNGARIAKTYSPFIRADGVGALIEHNYFYNHMQAAIIFNGNNNIIQKNIFDTLVTHTVDAGAIYTGRKTTKMGNIIRNNIFKNIKNYFTNPKNNFAFAVYIDDTMPGTTIDNNLFYNCSKAINIGGGKATKIRGNLFYDCNHAGIYYNRTTTKEWFNKGNAAWNFIEKVRNDPEYDEEKWYTQYPYFREMIEDMESEAVEELGEVIDEGTATTTPRTPIPERHKVKDAEVADNLFVCDAVKSTDDGGFSSIFGMNREMKGFITGRWEEWVDGKYKAYKISTTGRYENNLVSDDLSAVTINGNNITIDNKLFNEGYVETDGKNSYLNNDGIGTKITQGAITPFTIPDVSDAGPSVSSIDLSVIPTANQGTYKTQTQSKDMTKHNSMRADSFDNYSSSDDITKMRSFNATKTTDGWILSSSSVKFDGTGNVVIKGVSNYSAKLHLTPTTQFDSNSALYLKLSGSEATVLITDGINTITDSSAIEDVEYRIVNGTVTKYTLSDEKWVENQTFTETLNGITNITITADKNETVKLDYICLNKIGNNPLSNEYYDLDFEDGFVGQSPADYEGVELYNASKDAYQYITQDGNNKAMLFAQTTTTHTYDYVEFCFDPIYTKDKIINLEYAIKVLGDTGRITEGGKLMGYNADKTADLVESKIFSYSKDYYDLSLYSKGYYDSNDTQIASAEEIKSDFVKLRYEIDAQNSRFTVYKLIDGEWSKMVTETGRTLPDFVDRLQFWMVGPTPWSQVGHTVTDRLYLIDDIKIYGTKELNLTTSSNAVVNDVNAYKGQNLFIKPDYVPASQIGTLIGAVYDENGKLNNVNIKDFVPDTQLEMNIPDDNGKYYIKYFTWENTSTLKPVGIIKQFN